MNGEDRKAAVAAYKERKVAAGVYLVRCHATGQRWVGSTANLGAIQNRLWFTLRQGGALHKSLQAAWGRHGADSFTLEEVERLDDETLAYVRDRVLKERLAHWRVALAAEAV